MRVHINTFKFFGEYGFSYTIGKKWGNTSKGAWLAKILHNLNRGKLTIINIKLYE